MKHRVTVGVALGALLVILAGCSDPSSPSLPLEPSAPPREPTVPNGPGDFPSASRSGVIYDRVSSSFIPGKSRYVLYDDGTFSLQYVRPDWGFFEYPGKSSRADSAIGFKFDGWSIWGPWLADGVVRSDSLSVKYNLIMAMNDFEDGVYLRTSK